MHVDEQQVLFKEQYSSSTQERFYVKPDQGNIVVLDERKSNNLQNWITKLFLPQGYPESVSNDYISYQLWDTAQAFCSTITGTLATQEVLRGVGVGDTTASPLAATVIWVLKDGCGHLGRIIFACTHGTHLDAYSKKWRLYADVLNDAAMCAEMALPLFKNYTTMILCISTLMKAIVGVAGGATRAALTQHQAIRGNMADVSAKDSAQETAVNLVASLSALLVISLFGDSILLFILLMTLHIFCNYRAVKSVCLRTLNESRFLLVIETYIKEGIISTPRAINRKEPIIFYPITKNQLDEQMCGFQIEIGVSLKKMCKSDVLNYMSMIKDIYKERNYVIHVDIHKRKVYVFIKDKANTEDVTCAYFHAVLLAIITSGINGVSLPVYKSLEVRQPYDSICETLQSAKWSNQSLPKETPSYNSLAMYPSLELLRCTNNIIQMEWHEVKTGLTNTGWDLSKHLLIADEWRICSHKKEI